MLLVLVWLSFISVMIFCKNLDQSHYLLFSSLMFYFIYIFNKIKPLKLTIRGLLIVSSIPNCVFGYVAFVYNNFLSLNPINYEFFLFLIFIYIYILGFIFLEYKDNLFREKS